MNSEELNHAVKVFKEGGIVVFPTDTAYGIGCRIDKDTTVKKLFEIRRRSEQKATPVLVSDFEMARKYWQEIPNLVVEKLVKPYWPGGLTIVFNAKTDLIPALVLGGGNTLGVRMPDHSGLRKIIQAVGVPILAPSANFAGKPTPYKFEDIDKELLKLVDYVLPGECSFKNQSTVVDCSTEPWKILRTGAINISI